MLSRDDILKAEDLPTKPVDVPEWGGEVLVRGLTGAERDAFEASLTSTRPAPGGKTITVTDTSNIRAKLVVRAVVDVEGNRLFRDQDAAAVGAKSGAAIDRLFDAIRELSGMTDDEADELEGNSEAVPSDGSTSD